MTEQKQDVLKLMCGHNIGACIKLNWDHKTIIRKTENIGMVRTILKKMILRMLTKDICKNQKENKQEKWIDLQENAVLVEADDWAQGWIPHGNSLATQIRRQEEDGLMFGTSIVDSKIIGS